MDMMEIRRRVMEKMAKGKKFVSGTFTCGEETTRRIEFGQTFNKYLYLLELTDESKQALIDSGISYTKTYAWAGIFPRCLINGKTSNANSIGFRYTPETDETITGSTGVITLQSDYFEGYVRALSVSTGPTNYLIRGYSYNYIVVSLD